MLLYRGQAVVIQSFAEAGTVPGPRRKAARGARCRRSGYQKQLSLRDPQQRRLSEQELGAELEFSRVKLVQRLPESGRGVNDAADLHPVGMIDGVKDLAAELNADMLVKLDQPRPSSDRDRSGPGR